MLSRMMFFCGGAFVCSYLKDADFEEQGAIRDDAEILIDILRGIAGVRVALILKENGKGEIRGSLRAKDETDVAQIARDFEVPSDVIETCFPEDAEAEVERLCILIRSLREELDG